MEKAQVIIEHTYPSKPQRIWQAITDPQQMKQWYMPVDEFQAEVGFKTEFAHHYDSKSFSHAWKVTEVIPEKKISYEWQVKGFPGNSRVTFELTPDGDGTHLTVTHTGLETYEGDKNPDLSPENINEGWHEFIDNQLVDFLKKPDVFVTLERTYNAPVEKVWTAITDLGQMKKWYMPLSDFRAEVGFQTKFTIAAKGNDWTHIWKVTEVIPNKKLSYEWKYEGFPGNSLVTFELTKQGNKTHLKLTHTGIESFEGQKHPGLETFNFRQGWTALIGTLLRDFVQNVEVPA